MFRAGSGPGGVPKFKAQAANLSAAATTYTAACTIAGVGNQKNLIAAYAPGAEVNGFTGSVGMSFVPATNLLLVQASMRAASDSTGLHIVSVRSASGTVIGTATIDLTGSTVGQVYSAPIQGA